MDNHNKVQAIFLPASLALTLTVVGCAPSNQTPNEPMATHHTQVSELPPPQKLADADPQSTRHLYQMQGNRARSKAELEEYVSRIGKRVIITSRTPKAKINFKVTDNEAVNYQVDGNGTIQVSRQLLKNLRDEAELAAILSHGIAEVTKADGQAEIEMMSNAGFDPRAAVDLKNNATDPSKPWLKNVYQRSHQQVDNTSTNTLPKGLRRGAEDYRKAVGIDS